MVASEYCSESGIELMMMHFSSNPKIKLSL